MNEAWTRQESLGINQDQSIAVIGCGGVGSWVALELALAGVRELHLFDSDEVSTTNLNRIAAREEDIGIDKSYAVERLIWAMRAIPVTRIIRHPNFNLLISKNYPKFDWLVVATDTGKSRDECFKWAKTQGIKYLELGAEGHMATLTGSPGDWETSHEADPGYASVPVWVGPCVLAATMACYYILLGQAPQQTFRLGWNPKPFEQAAGKFDHKEWAV